MTRKRGLRVLWNVIVVFWVGCLSAWATAWDSSRALDDGFLRGALMGLAMGVVGPWIAQRMARNDKDSAGLLSPEDHDAVEEALRTGEPSGRIALRAAQRDAARQRLADHPPRRAVLAWLAVGLAAPYVLMPFAHARPLPLVLVTVATTVLPVVLIACLWPGRAPDLPADERGRLRALARQRL